MIFAQTIEIKQLLKIKQKFSKKSEYNNLIVIIAFQNFDFESNERRKEIVFTEMHN